MDEKSNIDLIGLFVLIHFPNLELIRLNVCMLLAIEIYGICVCQPTYEFLLVLNIYCLNYTNENVITRNEREHMAFEAKH